MAAIIPQKVEAFLGLNNRLEPSSPMYREGMAWRSMNARLDESGQWSPRQNLIPIAKSSSDPNAEPVEVTAFGSGNHMKNVAINNIDCIVTGIATSERIDVGANGVMYSTTGSGAVKFRQMFTISQIEEDDGTVLVTTSESHGLQANQTVDIVGTTNYNTTAKSVLDDDTLSATTFSYTQTSTSRATENAGYASPYGTVNQIFDIVNAKEAPTQISSLHFAIDATTSGEPDYIPDYLTTAVGNRAELGTYYYMLTFYDPVRKRESLPSPAYQCILSDLSKAVTIDIKKPPNGLEVRLYRTKRTYTGSDTQTAYHPTNIFYFVNSFTDALANYQDLASDEDIGAGTEYDGRGTVPASGMDYLVSYNDRMLYFEGNRVYWSSPGHPEEVATEYSLDYYEVVEESWGDEGSPQGSITCVPRLSLGVYAEAYYDITEVAGKTIRGAIVDSTKLRIWTDGMCGYLKASGGLEGYRFTTVRHGVGLVSDKYLAQTPYGIFGVDRQGMWIINYLSAINRLSDAAVDFHDSEKDTYLEQAAITDGFGVWVPGLNEYWWCGYNPVNENYVQIAYQANRGLFVGPYDYELLGGTTFVSIGSDATGGAQACLNVYDTSTRYSPSLTAVDTSVTNYIDFWFGQASPTSLKDRIRVEIIHPDMTGDATASILLNRITSETGAITQDNDVIYNNSPIGLISANGEARNFKVKCTFTSGRKLSIIQYQYDPKGWHPQHSIDE